MTPTVTRLPNGIFTVVTAQGRVMDYAVHCTTEHEARALAESMPAQLAIEASA